MAITLSVTGMTCDHCVRSVIQGALEKAGQITLESHLRAHVATAAERGDTETIVEELMDALRYR